VDNDVNRGVIGFSAPVYTVTESGGVATITVTRTGGTGFSMVVYYSIGGTASNGKDYAALPGKVTIFLPADDAGWRSLQVLISKSRLRFLS